MLTTTLQVIKDNYPCESDWELLLKNLGKTHPSDEPLTLMQILESNGIEYAVWSLRCFDYKEQCLFSADVAESVLHIYDSKGSSKAPRLAIQAVRDYKAGTITEEDLQFAASAARASAVHAYAAAWGAAWGAAYAAAAAAAAAAHAVSAHAVSAYAAAAAAADDAADGWDEIKKLFIKHFGE